MNDIFTLSISKKEKDFVNKGVNLSIDAAIDIVDIFYNVPFVGFLIKIKRLYNNYQDIFFIRKLAKFLEKDIDIPTEKKLKFLEELDPNKRKKMYEYVTLYLFRAEDEDKADIMGYLYKECIFGQIDNELFLRLCSIVDKAFLSDLKKLPTYIEKSTDFSIYANNFINLGLIDNYVGGSWVGSPSYELNEVGKTLLRILQRNEWYSDRD